MAMVLADSSQQADKYGSLSLTAELRKCVGQIIEDLCSYLMDTKLLINNNNNLYFSTGESLVQGKIKIVQIRHSADTEEETKNTTQCVFGH